MTETNDMDAELDTGLAHHEAGRFAEAEMVYRGVLRQEPDHPDALNLLGVILQDAGDLTESIAVLSRAVAADPGFAEAFVNLARAQCGAGDPAAAIVSTQRAIELDPDLAEAHLQAARAFLASHDDAAASAAATRAADLAPHSVDAHLFLGRARSRLRDYSGAADCYHRVLALDPASPEALSSLAEISQLDTRFAVVSSHGAEPAVPEILAAARAHQGAGRTRLAEAAYRRVIEREPDNIEALHQLGQLLRVQGDAPQALPMLRRAVAVRPGDSDLLVELARIHRLMGDFRSSAAVAGEAAALNPADPSAQFLLGSGRLDLDDVIGAQDALRHAIELAPQSADAHLYFAMACMRLKQFSSAATALREAVRLRPDDAESLVKLGVVLGHLREHDAALPFLRRALDLTPGDGRVHLAWAKVQWLANNVESSKAACDKALEIAPEMAELWLHRGFSQAALGRFAAAVDDYSKALALDPTLNAARVELLRLAPKGDVQPDAAWLRSVLDDPQMAERDRISAGHALGELCDRSGDYDAAWSAYAAAGQLAHASHQLGKRAFDAAAFDSHIEGIIRNFGPDRFVATAGLGDSSDLPVFVVGMPRSGTTLIEQILSSHADVFGVGELDHIHAIAKRLDGGPDDLLSIARDPGALAREAATYVKKLRDLGGDRKRVIDKMPDNYQWLGYIAVLFPQARIIICRRDLRDVGLSCYFQDFGDNLSWTTSLSDIAARSRAFDRLLSHWRAVLPLSILEMQYEDLVHNLESESRRLIEFLGLEWDPACLAFHKTERAVVTASMWQVRQPLYASSAGRWRNYRRHLQPLIAGLAGLVPFEGDEDWDALAADPATAVEIALTHHRAGRRDFAAAIYRALLRRNPDDPAVLHLLGVLLVDQGDPAGSIALIDRSLALRPDVAPVLADLAGAHRAAGNAEAAVEAARRALAIDPTLPLGLLQLGWALLMQQDDAAAVEVLQRATGMVPGVPEPWVALATALARRRNYAAAAEAWAAALALKPEDPGLLTEFAGSLADCKHFDEALAAYRQVETLTPGDPRVQYGIAVCLMNTGDVAAAAETCRRALAEAPEARFWLLLANCEAALGHFEAAAEACRNTLALDPGAAGALHDLVELGQRRDDDAARHAARQVLHDRFSPVRARVSAGFALGRVCDRYDAYDEAFEAYALANRLLRDERHALGLVFDRSQLRDLVDRQIATFDPPAFAATAGWGDPSEQPVFVVGMPRSGTSLVEQIAASHKLVFGAGEQAAMFGSLTELERERGSHHPAAWNRTSVRREAMAYVQRLQSAGGDALRIVDKQPDNILCLGQIAVLFPQARIVVCRRDPRDVGLSCFFQYFRDDSLVWADDLADCGFRAREIDRLMQHWRQVLPSRILEIQYETLVANLESESRRLIDFLGLDWDPACLSFHETERTVLTASHWQVRQPLYTSSVGRWRHYQHHLGPLLHELEGLVPADEAHDQQR